MKRCPSCQRTYSDESLSFCLADGELLSAPCDSSDTDRATVIRRNDEIGTEVPTIELARPAIADGVRWYLWLLGFGVGLAGFALLRMTGLFDLLQGPLYGPLAERLILITGFVPGGHYLAGLIAASLTVDVYFAAVAFISAFIWPRGGWKWGMIAVAPELLVDIQPFFTQISYFVRHLDDISSNFYMVIHFVGETAFVAFAAMIACLGATLGSGLSKRQTGTSVLVL